MSEYNGRWMWCGECKVALLVSYNSDGISIDCPLCDRHFEWEPPPPGGEVNGVPPFLEERVVVE